MVRRKSFIVVAVLAILPWIGLGCGEAGGPKPPMGKVKGKVIYAGKPLTKGTVTFVPIQGKGGETGQTATGSIESDGSFELTTFNTGDGALIGQHTAVIQVRDEAPRRPPPRRATGSSARCPSSPGKTPTSRHRAPSRIATRPWRPRHSATPSRRPATISRSN